VCDDHSSCTCAAENIDLFRITYVLPMRDQMPLWLSAVSSVL
jgi:hypothetical protein